MSRAKLHSKILSTVTIKLHIVVTCAIVVLIVANGLFIFATNVYLIFKATVGRNFLGGAFAIKQLRLLFR